MTANPRPEPWFAAYTLVGAVAAGLAPLLLPLWVSRSGNAAHVGLVMAALSLGQLSAPLWGQLADKRRWHRQLFVSGLLLAGLALSGAALSRDPYLLATESFALGLGIAVTTTVANLFIVERYPQESWSARLGALQTAYALGQVGGLVVAGLLSTLHLGLALAFTALLPFTALGFSRRLPTMSALAERPGLHVPVHLRVEPLFASLAHAYHLRHWFGALRHLKTLPPTFARLLLLWLTVIAGSSFIFAFYPLLLAQRYDLATSLVAWGYAGAVALGLLLYTPVGRWAERYGASRVLRLGILLRLGATLGLSALELFPLAHRASPALLLFAVLVLAWPLHSVTGTTLAANAGLPQGEALGLFSASGALAGVAGALLGGVLVHAFGYTVLPLTATLFLTIGLVLSQRLSAAPKPSQT